MALGKRKHEQQSAWVATTELPKSPGHPFYKKLNQLLAEAGFDAWLETLCAPYYAAKMGRESIPPGVCVRSANPTSIATPYGEAVQDASAAALRARAEIQGGARVYKGGTLGRSETGASQFLATESPLNPGYAGRYGVPPENANFDFILTGRVRDGAPIITRPSPGIPPNPGGGIEGVFRPGDFIIDSFYMP